MAVFTGNGSAGSPSFTFSSSTNTGMWRGSGGIAFSVGGNQRFSIDANGRLFVKNFSNIPSTGSVNSHYQQHGLSNDESALAVYDWNTSGFGGPFIFLNKAKSGAIGTHTAVGSGERLSRIVSGGSDGTAFREAVVLNASSGGAVSAGSVSGVFSISTTPVGGSSASLRMIITEAGKVGIGKIPDANENLVVGNLLTGSTQPASIKASSTVASDVTNIARGFVSSVSTEDSAFTLSELTHFLVDPATKGASSTITNQYGVKVSGSLTGATNNYAIWSNLATAAGRWNLYINGDADNYIRGNVKIGGTADRATTPGDGILSLFNRTAPVGTLSNGISLYSSAGEAYVMDAAGNATLISPHDSETNEWVFDSTYTPTGKRLRIRMEAMMRAINEHFGWDFIEEFAESV